MVKAKQASEKTNITKFIIEAIQDKKGKEIKLVDLRSVSGAICDYFIICHGESSTQIQAIAESVEKRVKINLNEFPYSKEGIENSEWILLDYVDVVVHLFRRETREFYGIEDLWGDAEITEIEEH
ncbi:MAG: ribosome silencing factor [Bacteroidetes bacterium]|nr:ribosome silencing factor [Bacteroidia bacterium]PCH68726.1 MAG: ribosome silencing factor [Bacteroidota bacterium]